MTHADKIKETHHLQNKYHNIVLWA